MKLWKTTTLSVLVAMTAPPVWAQDIVEGPEVHWQMSLWGNPRALTAGVEELASLLSERTDGRFTIDLVYGEQLSAARENLDGLQIGAFETALVAPVYHPGRNPLAIGIDLPFLPIPDLETRQRVVEAYFSHPAPLEEWESQGVRPFYTILSPSFEFMGVGEPPRELADWEGMRVRANGALGDAMQAVGASPVTISAPEGYQALERGMLDAFSSGFTYAFGSYGIHDIADWYTTNMQLGVGHAIILVSLPAWEALPQQYRDLVEDVKDEAYAANIQAMQEADEEWLPIFEERGMTAVTISEEARDAWIERAAEPIWNEWVTEQEQNGRPGQELLDLILETATQTPAG